MKHLHLTLIALLLSFASFAAVDPITGTAAFCLGTTTTLSDATPSGTWSSANPSVATVGASSGVVTGLTPGTAEIFYLTSSGTASVVVTVLATPGIITGPSTVCVGATINETNSIGGGMWTADVPVYFTVGMTTGVVTGIAAGVADITYTISTGCYVTRSITVNPIPAPGTISGASAICEGLSTPLTTTATGGSWSASNGRATISSGGLLTGITAGLDTIKYTVSTTCGTAVTTLQVTIASPASAGTISGTTNICAGSSATLSNPASGGTWISTNVGVASVDAVTGLVTGNTAGTTNISYIMPTGCGAGIVVTVSAIPTAITGPTSICTSFSVTLNNATIGGTWSTSSPGVATVTAAGGVVTGVAPGLALINYTVSSGCSSSIIVTVSSTPPAGPITGSSVVCTGNTIGLTGATPGGTWSSSTPAIGSVNSAGNVTGIAAGTTTIFYTMPVACGSTVAAHAVTVTTISTAGTLSGVNTVCAGSNTVLSSTAAGGTWSSGATAIGTVGATTGVVTGISAGTVNITYTVTLPCGTSTAVMNVTVNPLGVLSAVPSTICIGNSTTVNATPAGGVFSTSSSLLSVDPSTGSVTGVSAGAAAVTYTSLSGCVSNMFITVSPATSAGTLSGSSTVCIGGTTTLASTVLGGTWSVTNPRATVSAGGVVTGVSAGLDTVIYTVSSSCGIASAMWGITVSATPTAGSITGATSVCVGLTSTLSDVVTGGVWTTGTPAIATINATTGVWTGVSAGTAIITYTVSMSCGSAATNTIVTVTPTGGSIIGTFTMCPGGSVTLMSSTPGGTWAIAPTTVATVNATTGVVTGITGGTATATYTLASGCVTTHTVTVNPLAAISITATPASCGGTYTAVASGGVSYTWSPSSGLTCTNCPTTVIDPVSAATYTVVGTDINGCVGTATTTVGGNRIYGHIFFGSVLPAVLDTKVWLIQYNPADSSITATDSVITCNDAGVPYYQFDGKPSGNYLLKAKLQSSVAGTSGYIPTYGTSDPSWYTATNISHTTGSDIMNITMLYGTVPSGPGFISGNVYTGAGKGTAGLAAAPNMLILLRNAFTFEVVTYTYTDAAGVYSFSNLGIGSYIIYPEDYKYYTTPSAIYTIGSPLTSYTGVNFRQRTTAHTITPYSETSVNNVTAVSRISVYPNPTSGTLNIQWSEQATGNAEMVVTDVLGREVYTATLNMNVPSGNSQVDLSSLKHGVYFIILKGSNVNYSSRLIIE